MKNQSNKSTAAIKLFSVLTGHDYATGTPVKTMERDFGADYSDARKLIEEHPELVEAFRLMEGARAADARIHKSTVESLKAQRNELRTRYNDLCADNNIDDYIEEYYS